MQILTITDRLNGIAPAIIFAIIFGSFISYFLISLSFERAEEQKIKKINKMIYDGHSKAQVGKKDDGLYSEKKKLKEKKEETEELCEQREIHDQQICQTVANDLEKLQ